MRPSQPIPIVIPHVDLVAENAALRTENASPRQRLSQAEAVIEELHGVVADLRKQVESQQSHIHRLVKLTFGRGGERVEGPTLFDVMPPPETTLPVVTPPPPVAGPPKKRRGHARRGKPADLPRQRIELDLTDAEKLCGCCGAAKIRMGQTTRERLDYQPASIHLKEYVLPSYVCRGCEQAGRDPQIAKPVPPPEPLPKSNVEAGLLAHVIVSKICDHLPLHRQESILARHGLVVRRSTLCDHLRKCSLLLKPLYDLMRQRLLQSFAIHADDSPVTLLRPHRTATAWVYLGDA